MGLKWNVVKRKEVLCFSKLLCFNDNVTDMEVRKGRDIRWRLTIFMIFLKHTKDKIYRFYL